MPGIFRRHDHGQKASTFHALFPRAAASPTLRFFPEFHCPLIASCWLDSSNVYPRLKTRFQLGTAVLIRPILDPHAIESALPLENLKQPYDLDTLAGSIHFHFRRPERRRRDKRRGIGDRGLLRIPGCHQLAECIGTSALVAEKLDTDSALRDIPRNGDVKMDISIPAAPGPRHQIACRHQQNALQRLQFIAKIGEGNSWRRFLAP